MLNFGYWDDSTDTPLAAQQKMSLLFANFAKLEPHQRVIDVGSGHGLPAQLWQKKYSPLDITSLNINHTQLQNSPSDVGRLCATATILPFADSCVDRVIALESAQHFQPLTFFISESFRVLKNSGHMVLAIPVMSQKYFLPLAKLGLLSMTWSSEHYTQNYVLDSISRTGFEITSVQNIGSKVYVPLANYYHNNRESIGKILATSYPKYVESILYKSIMKMKQVSENKTIDYILVSAKK